METINTELIRLFVKVVQCGGFSKAAELLRIPKSTVSKAITKLESETKTKLLIRTTRSFTLTSAGRVFYDTCLGPIQTLEEAQKSLYGQDSILSGTVRITAPEDIGSELIAPIIADLTNKHPLLGFELHYSNEIIDLVRDGFDFAVRVGRPKESGLKIKPMGEIFLYLVASPSYLKSKEKLRSPKDLEKHECLGMSALSVNRKWYLKSSKEVVHVPVKSRIVTNQMTSLLQLALSGAGIALIPSFLCQRYLQEGKIIRILPEWSSPGLSVSLLSTQATATSARLKLVSNSIVTQVQKTLGSLN